MSYLIKALELSTKSQVEIERKDYLSKPLEEQGSIGVKLLEEDLKKTTALDLVSKIMRNQQTQIQAHQSKLGRPLTNAEIDAYLAGHKLQEIYDQTTDAILRKAELLIESEKKQLKKLKNIKINYSKLIVHLID